MSDDKNMEIEKLIRDSSTHIQLQKSPHRENSNTYALLKKSGLPVRFKKRVIMVLLLGIFGNGKRMDR